MLQQTFAMILVNPRYSSEVTPSFSDQQKALTTFWKKYCKLDCTVFEAEPACLLVKCKIQWDFGPECWSMHINYNILNEYAYTV